MTKSIDSASLHVGSISLQRPDIGDSDYRDLIVAEVCTVPRERIRGAQGYSLIVNLDSSCSMIDIEQVELEA